MRKGNPVADRAATRVRARALWSHALHELEEPGRRPCLLMLAGLPGTGKSTLARGLAERAGFTVIRSDVVRKELAGRLGQASSPAAFAEDIYTPEWDDRTYAEALATVTGIIEQLASRRRMRIGDDIVILKIGRCWSDRQVVGENSLLAEQPVHLGHEPRRVPVADLLA